MKPAVKGRVAVFHPQGFLDGNNAPSYVTIDDIKAIEHMNIDMLLVSLKKVIFFNKNGLDVFIKTLLTIRSQKHISVGLCDYDHVKFTTIISFYKNALNFSLFRTEKIAELFAPSNKSDSRTVLLYNEDPSQRSAMAIELFDYGHNPVIAQSKKEFDEKKQHPDLYYAIIEESYLGIFGQKIATRVTGNAVIYTIANFLDAEIGNTFNITYHNNSLNVGFRLFIFDAHKVVSMNVHALNFLTKLASSAAEYNATICFVGLTFEKTPESFKHDLEDAGTLFFNTMDDILNNKQLLQDLGGSSPSATKTNRALTKALINELPNFIDATVSTIAMMTNAKAVKNGLNIQTLAVKESKNQFASSIGFYGDVDGIIILVFPKNIAKKACELLIGEETEDEEAILDSLAEFVNIIGGRAKALLGEKKQHVDITLPRTYGDIDALMQIVQNKKGVQVDLSFEGSNFTFFLTR
ncbi:MAG: chemotaxis protein CheX [Sulfuricurvum sp.]|jgi:CheY-specific phosphatase CheX/anti-anti-sigma regulatory factor|uniref:chemotaxis protein CheX n=1 Tax=Sulfuricurvum sp. TaxID=2025608 RepID=UPI0025FBDFD8|nr:chemotaxis protein CheX [Sulfuricurvum sp.]MCK9374378.1 chemotaxis protein CheX [Sulfuricurvum sp.]